MGMPWWKQLGCEVACGTALLTVCNLASAQQPPSETDQLRERIERLERQNEQLLKLLQGHQGTPGQAPQADVTEKFAPLGREEVQKIVSSYLQERDEQKAAAEEQLKQEGSVVGRDLAFKASWQNGLTFETGDKAFKVHVGGRTQWDFVWMNAEDAVMFGKAGTGRIDDAVNPRRARLRVDGVMWEVIDFVCEYEFLGNTFNEDPLLPATSFSVANTPGPTDVYLTIMKIPWLGNFRIGSSKPPISLEHLTSSRWLDFMERSFCFDAYIGGTNNGFLPGMQVFNTALNQRITGAVGVFKNDQTVLGWNVGDGEYDVTGRVTCLPVYEENGRYLLHLGLGASHRDLDEDVARLRARTLLRNGNFILQTRLADITLGGASQTLLVPEFALVTGPLKLQAEYYANFVNEARFPASPLLPANKKGTHFSDGGYVEALYFLTGEHNIYDTKIGAFTRVVPNRNYFWVPGEGVSLFSTGAWQVGARYSWIDFNSKGVNGGILQDLTLGLNWFLNPNAKFQWNYSLTYRDAAGSTSDGFVQGFGMRLAFDF